MAIASDDVSGLINKHIDSSRAGYSLAQFFYTDKNALDREMGNIFSRQWLMVDHVSRIPNKGDYFLFQICNDSIIIVRESDDKISAYHNVCRHRGSLLCLEPEGNKRVIVCPYHAWGYGLDGSLLSARSLPEDFDKKKNGLHPVRVQVFHGLIFINLSKSEPKDFYSIYSGFDEILDFHGIEKAKVAVRKQYESVANWKLIIENFYECYHCAPCHPEYCSVHPADQLDAIGAGISSGSAQAAAAYESKVNEWLKKTDAMGHPRIELDSDENDFTLLQGYRSPINDRGYQSETLDGKRACNLLMGKFKECDGGDTGLGFSPINFLFANNDQALLFRYTPRDTLKTDIELIWLVHEDAVEGVDYDPEKICYVWDVTTHQDKAIAENNQFGVMSSHYQPGRYSEAEQSVIKFINWYLKQMRESF